MSFILLASQPVHGQPVGQCRRKVPRLTERPALGQDVNGPAPRSGVGLRAPKTLKEVIPGLEFRFGPVGSATEAGLLASASPLPVPALTCFLCHRLAIVWQPCLSFNVSFVYISPVHTAATHISSIEK